jgi:3-methyl-2-oxobutanoate hydroxymethyltransferase
MQLDVSKKRPVQQITLPLLAEKHRMKIPISMVTAYDYATAKSAHEGGVDMILVGDSLGMVVLGHSSTVPVTMDDMLRHAAAVSRTQASRKAYVQATAKDYILKSF